MIIVLYYFIRRRTKTGPCFAISDLQIPGSVDQINVSTGPS